MGEVTSSGMTPLALGTTVFFMVALCTAILIVIGVLIDRMAARHEQGKGR